MEAGRALDDLEAYQDVLTGTTRTYDHVWERGVYTEAYNQAVEMLRVEGE